MQHFLGDPDSGKLHLETHRLALAIAKKTLDKNRFTATQKTISRDNPAFQVGDHVYFKKKHPRKWDLKWRPGYQIVCIGCNGHFIHIENQGKGKTPSCNVTDIILEPPVMFWNVNTQSAEPATILTIPLIYPQYNSLIDLSNIAMHFHNSHPTVSSLNIIYIPAYYSHSPLP